MNHFITLLSLQTTAGIISLCGALLVVAVVILLIVTTTNKSEDGLSAKKKVYKVRRRYFWGLIIVLAVLLFFSLRMLPYPQQHQEKADEVVTVVGYQWLWKMAVGRSSVDPADFNGEDEISLPVDKTIRFVVTAADVNHDFAIYNSRGVLLAQTQAMPGYDNELQYTFTQKGDYKVLCLEYCGLAHAFMEATIHVH